MWSDFATDWHDQVRNQENLRSEATLTAGLYRNKAIFSGEARMDI